jgi:two-component system response regulator ResD
VEAHILVAEDEERLRTIIRDYFTAHGLTCALAKDGEEALERLRERDYDAVLLDVLMPNLDGFAVCRAVREGSGVPILFLTALGGEKDVLRGYALGADDYVTKPFSLAVLLAKTEALIRRSRGGGAETLACEGGDRAVDGRIKALRAALGPAGKQIRTVFKVGYKLEEGAHG